MNAVKTKQTPLLLGSSGDDNIEKSVSEALDKWDEALIKDDAMKERRAKLEEYVTLIENGE